MACLTKIAARPIVDLTKLCKEPEASPIELAQALDDATSKDWRDWLPETIKAYLNLPAEDVQQLDKILAVQVALTNADVFDDWDLFSHCNTAFNHRRVNFDFMELPSYIEVAWTCTVLKALAPKQNFGPGVLRWLTAVCVHDGVLYFPWAGLDVAAQPWSRGWVDSNSVTKEVIERWPTIQELSPSEVEETDVLHVQLAKLVNACEYIRRQK